MCVDSGTKDRREVNGRNNTERGEMKNVCLPVYGSKTTYHKEWENTTYY